jgi:hypothetical protein
MPINFEQEDRLGVTPTHNIALHNRINFVYLILTKYPQTKITWDNPIGKQTCHAIDDMTGKRCTNVAMEEGYCHDVATHVREMVNEQRRRTRLKEDGEQPFTPEEILVQNKELKINGLRKQSTTFAHLSECVGYSEIGELLDGFIEGSNQSLFEAINQIQQCVVRSYKKQSKLKKQQLTYTKDEIVVERREVIQALGALEGVLLRGTWRNRAPPTIEDNLRHWNQLFLLDSRFRVGPVVHEGMVGVDGGLENAVASHLTDFVDNVRLSLEEHVWNGLCHRAWLRILNCATDVYNIRGIDQDDGNERKEEQKEERTKSAFYTEPRLKNESVEFLYAFDSGYTNPLCFD